jgi:glycerophosphoryl diester phosphodiesterase
MTFLDRRRPRLFAHRGGAALAPENTLAAFSAGMAAGADILELDVHGTLDGHIVVIHDETLNRTTNGSGEVKQHTLSAIQRLDAGYHFQTPAGEFSFRGLGCRVPLLSELLEAFPHAKFNIEIKQEEPAIHEAVLAVLDRFHARPRTLLAAEEARVMARIRGAAPDILTSYTAAEVVEFLVRLQAGTLAGSPPPGVALQVPPTFGEMVIVTAESVAAAHALGLEVHVWTINEESEMEALVRLGVDGIFTDFPDRAVALFQRLGLR